MEENFPEILSESSSTKFLEKKKRRVLIISLCILLGILGIFFLRKNNSYLSLSQTTQISEEDSLSPTPFLFQEMTIPYLRSKTYESSLGELTQVNTLGGYTSYSTSYVSDGFKINGLLTEPSGEEPDEGWPAIVFVHGYLPPSSYQTTGQTYSAYVDYLARNGFVVFKIDLRGHGESEGEPGGSYYSGDYIVDVLNAYSALQNTEFVKKDGIGVWGHSMAGNVLLRTVVTKPEIPAVVIWGGAVYTYTDMREHGIQDSSYQPLPTNSSRTNRRQQLFNTYGQVDPESEFWKQVIPVNYLSDYKGVIQLHHAVDDSVVSVEYSRGLVKYLEKNNISHELFEYSTGGHNISGGSFTQAMERTVTFFKDKLQ